MMRVFKKPDGGFVQILGKERIKKWNAELPLLFIGYMRDNILPKYEDPRVRKAIEDYANEIMEEIAVPKLVEVLKGTDQAARVKTSQSLEEISKKKPDMVKVAAQYVNQLVNDTNKDVAKSAQNILKNIDRSEKKKQYASKRKTMQELDRKLAKGEVTDAEYMKLRKEYLKLEDEVGPEE
jgi:glutamyl-tRNA reductase